jgi:hypothetical protein
MPMRHFILHVGRIFLFLQQVINLTKYMTVILVTASDVYDVSMMLCGRLVGAKSSPSFSFLVGGCLSILSCRRNAK